jgi:hypothetical protein
LQAKHLIQDSSLKECSRVSQHISDMHYVKFWKSLNIPNAAQAMAAVWREALAMHE